MTVAMFRGEGFQAGEVSSEGIPRPAYLQRNPAQDRLEKFPTPGSSSSREEGSD